MIPFRLMVDVAMRKLYYADCILVTHFKLILVYWKVKNRLYAFLVMNYLYLLFNIIIVTNCVDLQE